MPKRVQGLDAVRGKNEWWEKNHELHDATVEGPWPHDDRFIVRFKFDVTANGRPDGGPTDDARRDRAVHGRRRQGRPGRVLL